MATNPEPDEGTLADQSAGRRGEVSAEMTAQDILSLAVNVAQNKWPLDVVGCGAIKNLDAMRVMLDELFSQILEANRRAASKRLVNQSRSSGCPIPPEPTPFDVDR